MVGEYFREINWVIRAENIPLQANSIVSYIETALHLLA